MEKVRLTEEQFVFVGQYVELVATIKDGFQYVMESFEDYSKTEGDQVLSDILSALPQVTSGNGILQKIFPLDVGNKIEKFDIVVEQFFLLDGFFNDRQRKEEIVKESIYPAFNKWVGEVEQELLPYIRS
ncbi:hypothetical protein QYG89_07445 [Bacillus sp. B190/17]|uniref:DUF8042 domain-containing protein n=1 Tax=Bacillus lumedeiriae TaxID=3058829 RepID=A0ABW8I7R5_9BACI